MEWNTNSVKGSPKVTKTTLRVCGEMALARFWTCPNRHAWGPVGRCCSWVRPTMVSLPKNVSALGDLVCPPPPNPPPSVFCGFVLLGLATHGRLGGTNATPTFGLPTSKIAFVPLLKLLFRAELGELVSWSPSLSASPNRPMAPPGSAGGAGGGGGAARSAARLRLRGALGRRAGRGFRTQDPFGTRMAHKERKLGLLTQVLVPFVFSLPFAKVSFWFHLFEPQPCSWHCQKASNIEGPPFGW